VQVDCGGPAPLLARVSSGASLEGEREFEFDPTDAVAVAETARSVGAGAAGAISPPKPES